MLVLSQSHGLPLVRNCTAQQRRRVLAGFAVDTCIDVPGLPLSIYLIAQHNQIDATHPLLRITTPVRVSSLRPYMNWQSPRLPEGITIDDIGTATLALIGSMMGRRGFYHWLIAHGLRGQRHPRLVDTCPICLQHRRRAYRWDLPCGHAFHEHCIVAWFAEGNRSCPICRARV
jgi:hypothetical protein